MSKVSKRGDRCATPSWPRLTWVGAALVGLLLAVPFVALGPGRGTAGASGSGFQALSPARLLDTRPGQSTVDGQFAGGGPIGPGATLNLTVTGRGGVPASGVGAVVVNVTATQPTTSGYLTVSPTGTPRPGTSNVNFAAGQTTGNLVIAPVGTNGQISLFNSAGSTQAIVDVEGWFPGSPVAGSVGTTLAEGQTLVAGQWLTSANGQYTANMQSDGNFVEYMSGRALWATGTENHPGAFLVVQGDGNLVLYNAAETRALWSSATEGHPGDSLVLQSDANLVVYAGASALWASSTVSDQLTEGQTLLAGQWLSSPGTPYMAIMQGDGNFVIYDGSSALWGTGTENHPGAYVVMQGDGNLVVYTAGGASALWGSATENHAGASAVLESDGELEIDASAGSFLWESQPPPSQIVLGQWPGTSGPAAADKQYRYPYPDPPACTDGGACDVDAWRFYQGQCTSWVAYRLNELNGVDFTDFYEGPQWGDATTWGTVAESLGIPVNGTPAVGSVAWYQGATAEDDGHVAYVEEVLSSTEVVISEMNYDSDNGFRVRIITTASGWPTDFIHIKDD